MTPPTFYVVAGPNGSGKTTFAMNDPALRSIPFINADIEAERLARGRPAKATVAAGRSTLARIARQLAAAEDFAFETTLSGSSTVAAMRRASSAGFLIDFTYVCLASPTLNIARVSMRVAAGGHHVPEADILRRYTRSLANLATALSIADRGRVFDNSESPKLLLETDGEDVRVVDDALPPWLRSAFDPAERATDQAFITARLKFLRQTGG